MRPLGPSLCARYSGECWLGAGSCGGCCALAGGVALAQEQEQERRAAHLAAWQQYKALPPLISHLQLKRSI